MIFHKSTPTFQHVHARWVHATTLTPLPGYCLWSSPPTHISTIEAPGFYSSPLISLDLLLLSATSQRRGDWCLRLRFCKSCTQWWRSLSLVIKSLLPSSPHVCAGHSSVVIHLAAAVAVFVVVVAVVYVVGREAQEGVSTQDMSHHLLSLSSYDRFVGWSVGLLPSRMLFCVFSRAFSLSVQYTLSPSLSLCYILLLLSAYIHPRLTTWIADSLSYSTSPPD